MKLANKYLLPIVAIAAISLPACKKDKNNNNNTTITPVTVDSSNYAAEVYMKLKPGNYWIYQEYKQDSPGVAAAPLGIYDSCYVAADTTIGANTYHQLVVNDAFHHTTTVYQLRDSGSYVVSAAGVIAFSDSDFTSVFRTIVQAPNPAHEDTVTVTERMGFKDSVVTVDAGTYTTYTFRQIWDFMPDAATPAQEKEYDHMYAKNVGVVKFGLGFYSTSPVMYEDRLVRYHVQ